VGPGGGYIVTSANSLTDYCKPENVCALGKAVEKYGQYPLDANLLKGDGNHDETRGEQ
jgi:hypothetical protein